jgi:hypothetical protein
MLIYERIVPFPEELDEKDREKEEALEKVFRLLCVLCVVCMAHDLTRTGYSSGRYPARSSPSLKF